MRYKSTSGSVDSVDRDKYGVLRLSKIGDVKIRLHRPTQGTPKTITIVREGRTFDGEWYACLSCDGVSVEALAPTGNSVGVDMGVLHFVTLSTGEKVENPRWLRKSQDRLAQKQKAVSLSKKGSRRQGRRRAAVARLHRHIKRQREDFQRKLAKRLVTENDVIVLEQLQIANMTGCAKPVVDEAATAERTDGKTIYEHNGQTAKSGLNKSIQDAGWGRFGQKVASKAEWAGRQVLFVAPRYTSQLCSGCGQIVPKELKQRWHQCDCGLLMDRDENAARNILAIGLGQVSQVSQVSQMGRQAGSYTDQKRAGSARREGLFQGVSGAA